MSTPSFQILRISSCSDVPVRNTANELIFGNHVLWEGKNTPVDEGGSLAPNVFSYDFKSPLSSNSTLNITLKVINKELLNTDLVLRGSVADDSKVFESDAFTADGKAGEITIAVSITDPEPSLNPVSLHGDFTWILVPKEQSDKVQHTLDKTLLELYWISSNIHEIFLTGHSGIAVDFLRAVRYNFRRWQEVTRAVFGSYSKAYDTVRGAPHFGVGYNGGRFQYSRYVAGNPVGSRYRTVNCYDQAAMVQVLGTIGNARPTWLFQNPYGYIKTTNLVGVRGQCNNPFFRSNNSPQLININDTRRTGFGNHVYNGYYSTFNPVNDSIFDACGGPVLGVYNPQGYINFAIDHATTLYHPHRIPRPGTVQDIRQYQGVTGTSVARTRPAILNADEDVERLLSKYAIGGKPDASDSRSHVHWDDLSLSIGTLFGDACNVEYHETVIGESISEEFWHLSGIAGFDGDVIIKIGVHTHIGEEGDLHHERSSRVAAEEFLYSLTDGEMDLGPNHERLDDIWVAAPFGDYAKYALQYGPHIDEGHVLLVCGNSFIDISGGSSSAALEPVIHKLLTHTTVNAPASLHVPHISDHFYDIPDTNKGPNSPSEVKGLFTSFDVKCNVDDLVSAASADTEGYGILLSKHNIEKDEVNKTSTVTFTFVTRTVGVHNVTLRFKKVLNMTTSAKKIQVTVVES